MINLFIYGLLFLIPIKIKVNLHRVDRDDEISVQVSTLLGLIKYKLSIPYLDIIMGHEEFPKLGIKTKLRLSKKDQPIKGSEDTKTFEEFKTMLQRLEDYSKYLSLLKNVLYALLQKLHIKNFRWITEIGSADAAVTGILTGILWMIKGQFLSFIKNTFQIDEVSININPHFNKLVFKTELCCIISIKIGHIINAGIKIAYLLILKGGELRGQSSNRSFDEDNHGKSKGYG